MSKITVVEWADAWIDTDDFKVSRAKKMKAVHRKTVGFFVAANEEGVILATDEYDKKKDGYAAPLFIPWGMVKNWYDV